MRPVCIISCSFSTEGVPLENAISKKDAVLLLTRLISLYLIFWAITDALALPLEFNSFVHYLHEHTELPASVLAGESHASATASYWMRYYFLGLILPLLQKTQPSTGGGSGQRRL